jgi:hypothetical protein
MHPVSTLLVKPMWGKGAPTVADVCTQSYMPNGGVELNSFSFY